MGNDLDKKNEHPGDKISFALEGLTKPISAIASTAAITAAYGYYLGTRYFDSYYTALGAPRISRYVATTDRLLVVVAPLALFLVFFSSTLDEYTKGNSSVKSIKKQILFFSAISFVFYSLHFGTKFFLKDYESHWWIGGALFIFLSLSECVSMSIILLSEKRSTYLSEFIYIFITIGLTACAIVANEAGRVAAETQLEERFSAKAIIILNQKSDCQWRAIQPLDSSKIVIVKPYKKPIYRIVDTNEIIGTYKAEKNGCKK